jgi:hypothetical protein
MRALSLTEPQLNELKLAAATLPLELRGDLLKLVAGFLEFEGDVASAAAFNRALTFAVDHLYRDVA